ncbi:hypothetical protein KSX_88300 [Ktedonospora formicarum]|uniref:Uncharacterized protein n=1 Tax=Ktedonospora formicarum TaxID=2778364 RepID=A0A8J3MVT0_9CHLR|nr:hypothetical protein KSX_88300 [Ktedonospora formicarum]
MAQKKAKYQGSDLFNKRAYIAQEHLEVMSEITRLCAILGKRSSHVRPDEECVVPGK